MRPIITYNSYISYKNIVYNYLDVFFKNVNLCQINTGNIKSIYDKVTEKHKSVARLLRVVLKGALQFSRKNDLISSDPSENIYLSKTVNYGKYGFLKIDTTKVLNDEQVFTLVENSKETPIYLQL